MENLLIGKTIVEMKVAEDKVAILFVTDTGEHLIARCDADCCSYTWVESIEMPSLGLPFTISAIDDLELNADLDDQDGELAFYGAKITTDKGDLIIDYRNESNGYYGGSMNWPGYSYFYGGVYGQNVSEEVWVDIVDAG